MSLFLDRFGMASQEMDALLVPHPLRIETGIERLSGDVLRVEVRTDLPNCKGRMLDWWFKEFDTTQHLLWWHPTDHVEHRGWSAQWRKGRSYVGATIRAVEALGAIPPVAAVIRFHDPRDAFSPGAYAAACQAGEVSLAIVARIGFGDDVALDAAGDPLQGAMVHVLRDTAFGAVLRSCFLLAPVEGKSVSDEIGLGLLQHCHCEFGYLSRCLPSLYWADPANRADVPALW
ncbi:conserved hypothetical protein [Rhodospirillum rubrum ATCC 11170]|uniref:DAPG hydrolase PhiG domain-containing protein n=2 Tax=Rhodospirillum rubrum TaxID=1085 RepID=Q2RWL1_RHORT|nr:hypothetical protein [Rhodospirillum rubrum]ABC21484.1 conserved hypothetical protein [Rhodospirillum rubrum ATCC 11170]MBK5953080.1 hydrolase [Rhodospirillum rubrum]QXG81159.1 hydrolase [Rhodospirillum rubrum]